MKTLIRCASHRARQKLFALLPEKPQGYYSWKTYCTGGFWEIPTEMVPQALTITGITRATPRYEYLKCWDV